MSASNISPTVVSFGEDVLERMVLASQRVQERLIRAISVLERARIPYAVGGSNATAIWIAAVDPSAVRQARNVELVLRREDLEGFERVLQSVGFVKSTIEDKVRFLDGHDGRRRDSIEITFAGERIPKSSANLLVPQPEESQVIGGARVLDLTMLVQFQLARYRLDDIVDLRDMIDVCLIDRTWLLRLQPHLASRLQELLDNPDG